MEKQIKEEKKMKKEKKPKEDILEKVMKENIKLKERLEKYKPKPKEVPQPFVPSAPKLCACGKEVMWDINIRDKCAECNHKHFLEEFKKAGLNDMGFSTEKKKFYSHTTGVQPYDLKFIKVVNTSEGCFPTKTFPCMIYICDEYGIHQNTLGITRGFADYLIKELKLVNDVEGKGWYYYNPLIKEDEQGRKKAELEKEIQRKTKELETLKINKEKIK
jgi:hypothetical protein